MICSCGTITTETGLKVLSTSGNVGHLLCNTLTIVQYIMSNIGICIESWSTGSQFSCVAMGSLNILPGQNANAFLWFQGKCCFVERWPNTEIAASSHPSVKYLWEVCKHCSKCFQMQYPTQIRILLTQLTLSAARINGRMAVWIINESRSRLENCCSIFRTGSFSHLED